jgi:hypothetical protein
MLCNVDVRICTRVCIHVSVCVVVHVGNVYVHCFLRECGYDCREYVGSVVEVLVGSAGGKMVGTDGIGSQSQSPLTDTRASGSSKRR